MKTSKYFLPGEMIQFDYVVIFFTCVGFPNHQLPVPRKIKVNPYLYQRLFPQGGGGGSSDGPKWVLFGVLSAQDGLVITCKWAWYIHKISWDWYICVREWMSYIRQLIANPVINILILWILLGGLFI